MISKQVDPSILSGSTQFGQACLSLYLGLINMVCFILKYFVHVMNIYDEFMMKTWSDLCIVCKMVFLNLVKINFSSCSSWNFCKPVFRLQSISAHM